MAAPAVELRVFRTGVIAAGEPVPRVPDPGNVVAFVRAGRRGEEADRAWPIGATRLVPAATADDRRTRRAGLLFASILVHAGLLALLVHAPQALPGIELRAISVEIVIDTPTLAASAVEEPRPDPDAKPTASESPPSPEAAPDTDRAEPPPKVAAAPPPEATAPPPESVPQAEPEQPAPPAASDAAPERAPVAPPTDVSPKPPAQANAAAAPPPQRLPTHQTSPQRRRADRPADELKRREAEDAHGRTRTASSDSRASASADANYYGAVAAHLARYKQFPAEARSNHSQGVASVTFTIDGAGRVTAVRLVRATGVASLDQEAQAMTHRASPFPPPPSGHAMTFTVPVSFVMR